MSVEPPYTNSNENRAYIHEQLNVQYFDNAFSDEDFQFGDQTNIFFEPNSSIDLDSRPSDFQTRENDLERARRAAINATLVDAHAGSGGGLASIAGLDGAKQALKEALILPFKFPHLFTGHRKPWDKIMLFGPPGTGKTMLALAAAQEIGAPLYKASVGDLLSSWVGESEKLVRELFNQAATWERAMILFDEIDTIFKKDKDKDPMRSLKSEILTQIDNMEGRGITLLCNTNRPMDIDSALVRRFQRRIYVQLPDEPSRKQILMAESGLNLNWDSIVNLTEGYSGSDLVTLVNHALLEPVRELDTTFYWLKTKDNKMMPCSSNTHYAIRRPLSAIHPNQVLARDVVLQDFAKALQCCCRSIDPSAIATFEEFSKKFRCG